VDREERTKHPNNTTSIASLYNSDFQQRPSPSLPSHRIIECFGLEWTFKGHLAQPPPVSRDIFNWIRLLRAPSNLAWNVSRDGASTTSQSLPSSSDTYSTLLHLEELLLLLKIFFFSSPSTHNFLCDHHCCDFTARSSLLTLHVHHSRLPGCRLLPLPRQRKTLSCTTNETSWCLDTLFLLNSSNKHLIQDGTS